MRTLLDRVAVVTGAASGIGRATALELARRGAHLALADLNDDALASVAEEIERLGRRVSRHRVDVAVRADMERFVAEVLAAHGVVHVVVNNAGVALFGPFREQTLDDQEWLLDIDLRGVLYGCKLFLPHLEAAGEAHIVNVSSAAGYMPCYGLSSYTMAKFGVRGLSETLRMELAPLGIGVTTVHPGTANTNITRVSRMTSEQSAALVRDRGIPFFQRFGLRPEQVARCIADGILANRQRVIVGFDAHVLDLMKRLAPDWSDRLIAWGNRKLLSI